jgi:hypothetical protein
MYERTQRIMDPQPIIRLDAKESLVFLAFGRAHRTACRNCNALQRIHATYSTQLVSMKTPVKKDTARFNTYRLVDWSL